MPKSKHDCPVLTVREVANTLKISTGAVYRAAQAGSLPFRRVGRILLCPRVALEAWLAGNDGSAVA
jgi:excisionase family DNA binding protein